MRSNQSQIRIPGTQRTGESPPSAENEALLARCTAVHPDQDASTNSRGGDETESPLPVKARLAASYGRTAAESSDALATQFEANAERARRHGFHISAEHRFEDNGVGGFPTCGSGLERLLA